jgi:putative copper resistance protein D
MALDPLAIAAAIAKALTYGASLLAAGGAFFLVLFRDRLQDGEKRSLRRLAGLAALSGVALGLVRILVEAAILGGGLSALFDLALIEMIARSGEGAATGLRIAGLLLVAALLDKRTLGTIVALLGALLVCVSYALVGHVSALEQGTLLRVLLVLHLIGLAYWLGALLPLRRVTVTADLLRMAAVMERFGNIALGAVTVLLIAGAALLWFLIDAPGPFLASLYGRLFVVKLALVIALLALAAHNKLSLTPRLAAGERGAAARLRRAIDAEIVLFGFILLTTALFTTVTGPPSLLE